MVGLTLFLLVTSTWAGTLRDNFNDGNADGWRMFGGKPDKNLGRIDESAQWVVQNGELVSTSQNVCTFTSIFGIGDNTWKDYEFEFQFRIEKVFPSGCGWVNPLIGFGAYFDNPNELIINGVYVVIMEKGGTFFGIACGQYLNGVWTSTLNVDDNISFKPGEWYTAKFVVKDNQYKAFVNNQLLCDTPHDLPEGGAAGLMGRNAEIHFDNVVITGDSIPNQNLGLPVDPQAKLATTWGEIKTKR